MGAWVTGHNLAGYLPEADTYAFKDWEDARQSLVDDMTEYADSNDEAAAAVLAATAIPSDYPDYESTGYGDDEPCMRAEVDAVLKDDAARDDKDFTAHVVDSDGHLIAFWLQWSDDREPDED